VGGIPFAKAHALGNDFLLVEESLLSAPDAGAVARRACDRNSGIGADGLVLLGAIAGLPWRVSFRIFNADGSEAGISGNALRCAAAWLLARDCSQRGTIEVPRADSNQVIEFETRAGLRKLFFLCRQGNEWIFRAEMGSPGLTAAQVPFRPPRPPREPVINYRLPVADETIEVTVLSIGNPQCIIFVEDFDSLDWKALGAEIECHAYFPERTNVGFARVLSREQLEARFWERGAGYTLASGTGSCACAVAAHLIGKTDRKVTVLVERGQMEVDWRADGVAELTGPAEIIAEGILYEAI
jgi:diaminopimelate epimerase